MNSNDDQSVSGASATQESSRDADGENIDPQAFQRWQKEHHSLTMGEFKDPTTKRAQATMTYLFDQVVDGHEKGSLVKSTGSAFIHEGRLNFQNRLENLILAIQKSAMVRYDLTSGCRAHELVANPSVFFSRKEENREANDKKKLANKKAKEEAKAGGTVKPKGKMAAKTASAAKAKDNTANAGVKAKTDNNRVSKGKAVVVEDYDESSNDAGEEDGESDSEMFDSSARDVSTSVADEDAEGDDDYGKTQRSHHPTEWTLNETTFSDACDEF
jgi:hypothetical protein